MIHSSKSGSWCSFWAPHDFQDSNRHGVGAQCLLKKIIINCTESLFPLLSCISWGKMKTENPNYEQGPFSGKSMNQCAFCLFLISFLCFSPFFLATSWVLTTSILSSHLLIFDLHVWNPKFPLPPFTTHCLRAVGESRMSLSPWQSLCRTITDNLL